MLAKSYIYTENELAEALKILKQINKIRIPCMIVFSAVSAILVCGGVYTLLTAKGSAHFEIFEAAFLFVAAVGVFCFGRFCANESLISFSEYHSADGNARERHRYSGYVQTHYRSPERIFSLEKHCIKITADCAKADSNGNLGKIKAQAVKYRLDLCKIYENEKIFLFWLNSKQCDAVPKNIFTAEELGKLRQLLLKREVFITDS